MPANRTPRSGAGAIPRFIKLTRSGANVRAPVIWISPREIAAFEPGQVGGSFVWSRGDPEGWPVHERPEQIIEMIEAACGA